MASRRAVTCTCSRAAGVQLPPSSPGRSPTPASTTSTSRGALAAAGDFDGDGIDDIAIGAPGRNDDAGAAYLVLGERSPSGGSLSSAIEYSGEAADDNAGGAVSGGGDVDGDGYDDYLVLGSSSVTSQSLSGMTELSGADTQLAGISVALGGDVDGDGHADVIVGANGDSTVGLHAGAAFLVYGSPAPCSLDLADSVKFTPLSAGVQLGASVAMAGDVDDDGNVDALFGAWQGDDAASAAGQAYLLLGTGL